MMGTNLTVREYIGYFQLFGERVPLREIKKRLQAFKLSNLVGELVRINTVLTSVYRECFPHRGWKDRGWLHSWALLLNDH